MKWIHIRGNTYKCPNCGVKFSINMQKPWKCCPICEQKLSGVEEQSISDYIKREDAIRAVKESMHRDVAVDSVNRIHSADVVKVVRCKDCKWWDGEEHNCTIRDSYGWDYKPNDYCSYGEQKEQEYE